MTNRIKVATPTKDQLEYDDAKKNFRIATTRMRLNSAGIDSSKISQQVTDRALRIFDDMENIQQDTQQKTQKIQHDAEISIQKVNQDANQKFVDTQKRYQDLINYLRETKGDIIQIDSQIDSQIGKPTEISTEISTEEPQEKSHDEKVIEITNILLNSLRETISEKVNDIMCLVDQKTNNEIAKNSDKELQQNSISEIESEIESVEQTKIED